MKLKARQFFASFNFINGEEMTWMRGAVITLLALAWMAPVWAAGGWVYDASGDVSIAVGKKPARSAIKNDAIASDTVINTGDKAYAVLKFEDGQVVVMQSNSTFHVREYRYEPDKIEKSNILFSMLKGGMRFVTGLIGQRNKTAFKLSTPNMTIGIRGTEFMVAMVNNSMYSQVVSGSIGLTNAAGTVALSAGQAAVATSATTMATIVPISALPAGTFSQLGAIPLPPATPVFPPAAGGAATGGATTTTTAATAGAATGVSATTIAIGVGVAATAAVIANTSTTTHH